MTTKRQAETTPDRRRPTSATRQFGERVRELRAASGMSQEELASRARIHPTYLSGVERGGRNPTLNVMTDLAKALGVTMPELVQGL